MQYEGVEAYTCVLCLYDVRWDFGWLFNKLVFFLLHRFPRTEEKNLEMCLPVIGLCVIYKWKENHLEKQYTFVDIATTQYTAKKKKNLNTHPSTALLYFFLFFPFSSLKHSNSSCIYPLSSRVAPNQRLWDVGDDAPEKWPGTARLPCQLWRHRGRGLFLQLNTFIQG